MPTRFFLQDIKSAPWNPSRNQDKDRSILPASTSTGCNLIFTGYSSERKDSHCETSIAKIFHELSPPAWHFSWLNALRFLKKDFKKKKKTRDFPRMNGIRRWNADELIPGEVNFTVEEPFSDESGGSFFFFY